jgi:hypothetical protein
VPVRGLDGDQIAWELTVFERFSITADSPASRLPTTGNCSSVHNGLRLATDPPPLAIACYRQPNWERPNGPRSRCVVLHSYYMIELEQMTETAIFFGEFYPSLPAFPPRDR